MMNMRVAQIVLILLVWVVPCFAAPASDETFFLKQPDGSSIEVRQVGDENFHVLETVDGYILQRDALGYYAYADKKGESSGIYARNAHDRSKSDIQFLAGLDPEAIFQRLLTAAPAEETLDYMIPRFAAPKIQRMPTPNYTITMGAFRGLVLLLQFSDIKFKSSNPQKQFSDYMNKEGYNEYANLGSVRDYFIKNSMGKFIPEFDVYGPVTVPGERSSYGAISKENKNFNVARRAFREGIDTLIKWGGIDFSKYDKNNDGDIDFFLIIYAGVGSNNSPVMESIWPHAGYLGKRGTLKSGKKVAENYYVNRYASVNEISGRAYKTDNNTSALEGVGSAIHELGHVLGLPDLYDTKSVHSRKTPSYWDVMASGEYNCPSNTYNVQCCAPPFYTAFERMSLGWLTPIELNEPGLVKLDRIDSNVAYSITNPKNPDELFLLEYRSQKDWDIGLKNSGMLIWHIDYVDSVWYNAIVNADSTHMYVDIIEAVPEKSKYATADDPFPGAGNVTEFSKFVFWNGDSVKIALSNIAESSDKEYVTFNVDMFINSSSSLVLSSSSSAELSSSSIESSSSEVSSSSVAVSSSSLNTSSSTVSSSSAIFSSSNALSSSSETVLSSSGAPEMSSSSVIASSSEVASSTSAIAASSSSVGLSSSDAMPSSSASASSSSEFVESSSSERPVFTAFSVRLPNVQVQTHNGNIYIYAPLQGQKIVRMFSPNGQLLFERVMDGETTEFPWPRRLGKQNLVISVSQGMKTLYMGMVH